MARLWNSDSRSLNSRKIDMQHKILIANRGEIALRVIRACRELGHQSVLIYSNADKDSLPVRMADEAICIGDAAAKDSYLKLDRIIAAADVCGADAIHPGYGFLSENVHFAEVCEAYHIHYIGPSSKSILMMGNKNKARKLMQSAGVPVVPGSDDVVMTVSDARHWASKIGYPIMIKASAGGGGKGMRPVYSEDDLENEFLAAQSEARQAFASNEMFIEKLIVNPKHVEIQILADTRGHIVHLGERDCSMQRRHQKVIEESPCLNLSSRTRRHLGEAAIKAAKSVGYTGAGTVEFLWEKDDKFSFMEMNTRIQVEHPVTEMVTGLDLVKEQIRLAFGEKLGYSQKEIKINGCAIEIRINAEDVRKRFAPAPGQISLYSPAGGPGVRMDSHIYSGYTIPQYYDSLLGKLIVWGRDRNEAIARAKRALRETIIQGVPTNTKFSIHLLGLDSFANGTYNINTIEDELGKLELTDLEQLS